MGQILGITGAIGSGKSTFAHYLCEIEPSHVRYETSDLIAEVAEDFNRALSGELAFETTSNTVELVNQALIWFIESISEKLHHQVTWNQLAVTQHNLAAHPEFFEKMLLYVDTIKKQPTLLDALITPENKETYRPLLQWLGGYLVAKISNTIWYDELFRRIRLHDDDKNLVIVGGVRYPSDAIVVREHGGIIVGIERKDLTADALDVTEASRSGIKADLLIHNDGSHEQLQLIAEELWNDLTGNKTKASYPSS